MAGQGGNGLAGKGSPNRKQRNRIRFQDRVRLPGLAATTLDPLAWHRGLLAILHNEMLGIRRDDQMKSNANSYKGIILAGGRGPGSIRSRGP